MTRVRQWSLGTALLFILILLGSWFLLVSPKKGEAAEIQTQTQTQISGNEQLRSKLNQLVEQSKHLADQQAKLASIQQHLPPTLGLATFIRTTSSAAASANVNLDSVAPTEPTAVPGISADGKSSIAGSGLYVVKVDIKATGSYYDLELFLKSLEDQRRSFVANGINLSVSVDPKGGPQRVSIVLTGRIYYAPADLASTNQSKTGGAPALAAPATASS